MFWLCATETAVPKKLRRMVEEQRKKLNMTAMVRKVMTYDSDFHSEKSFVSPKEACKHPKICASMAKPMQEDVGITGSDGGLKGVRDNVLFIADEIQTSLTRTGRSSVLCDNEIMLQIKPGELGSTYGGNFLACRLATAASDVLRNERLVERSEKRGRRLREGLRADLPSDIVTRVCGKFLTNAVVFPKVFLGGVPWDIINADLTTAFGKFGPFRVEWPGSHDRGTTNRPRGHLYLIFELEASVKFLLGSCSYDIHHGQHNWFYQVSSKVIRAKSVQVIPWQLVDATYSVDGYTPVHGNANEIFVAKLHGMVTADGLVRIMNDLFGGVVAATRDVDKNKYPTGSGRITFNNRQSHMTAIRAGKVQIETSQVSHQLVVDPFIGDSPCSMCEVRPGRYYCRHRLCAAYFCNHCWRIQHASNESCLGLHWPAVRLTRATVEPHF